MVDGHGFAPSRFEQEYLIKKLNICELIRATKKCQFVKKYVYCLKYCNKIIFPIRWVKIEQLLLAEQAVVSE